MVTPAKRFARILAELKAKGVCQQEVGQRLDTRAQFISDVKAGRCALSPAFAFRIESAFGVNHDWLLRGKGEPWSKDTPQGQAVEADSALTMALLPLLETVVAGDPSLSLEWNSARHPVARSLARPSVAEAHRYVLRVSEEHAVGEIKPGDLLLVENRPQIAPESVWNRLCAVRFGERCALDAPEFDAKRQKCVLRRLGETVDHGGDPRFQVLGLCIGILWRKVAGLIFRQGKSS